MTTCVLDFSFLLLFASISYGEKIGFPSGATLPTHDENVVRFEDPMKTGSKLFKVGDEGVTDSKRLTLNLDVASFRDKDFSYFRAHPVFMACVQKAWNEVQNGGRKMVLKQGFKLTSGSTKQDLFSRAGTGARLSFHPSEPKKSYTLIAVALLRHCPPLFGPLGLDLGLIVEPDSVFAFMTGHVSPSKWSIEAQGENPDFKAVSGDLRKWAREKMNEVTQPKVVPKCGLDVPELAVGKTHPSDASLEFVGDPDRPVRRSTTDPALSDLLRLVQFPSDNVAFRVTAKEAATCPKEGGYLGNGATTRCAPRLMAPRLFLCLNKLQQMVRADLKVGLKVTSGWAEAAEGLRAEGRDIVVQSDNAAILGKVARLAVCAGCDFVAREKDSVRLAIMKQFSLSSSPVSFPSTQLLPVAAPREEWLENYQLRSEFDNSDYPLFDGALQRNVSAGVPLSLFRSKEKEVRYLRLHPAIVKCFTEVVRWENRNLPSSQPEVGFKITQGFMSLPQEKSLMSPLIDERLDTHTLGIGLQLRYEKPSEVYTVWRLAETIASVCPLVFKTQEDTAVGRSIGLGIYKKDVHVDMRHEGKIWKECEDCELKPPGGDKAFISALNSLITNSANNRLIDPSDLEVACKFDNAPVLQSPSYVYKEAEVVKRVRRAASGSPECQIGAPPDTFCQQSAEARAKEVDKVWKIISFKYLAVSKAKVLAAVRGCLLSCSKCTSGPQWDAKMEHCENLVHWVPFGLHNAASDVRSNFFARGDKEAEKRACESGEHCVELSPLAALFSDSLLARFRPEPSKPNSELVYDPVGNPSPLPVLIRKLYALSAQGEVKVFLRSEVDVISMDSSLKVLFLYNKAVTKVRIFILDEASLNVVVAALEASLEKWRTTACPKSARLALTPYSVEIAPKVTSEAASYRERHLVRDLWEQWSLGVQRSDVL